MEATITISVPALPDNDVWFANSAAWTNYWADVSGVVTLDPATTTVYVASPYVASDAIQILVDGVGYVFVQKVTIDSIQARLDTLNTAFQLMRQQLKDAGLITQAQ